MADLPGTQRDSIDKSVVPIKPDDPAKSVSGRLFYLNALAEFCDGFWESLRDSVLFPCELFEFRACNKPFSDEMMQAAQACMDHWLLDNQVFDEWLVQTCHYTLASWAVFALEHGRSFLTDKPLQPFYGPTEASLQLALGPFSPVFEQPFPIPLETLSGADQEVLARSEPVGRRIYEAAVTRESAKDFKRRMRKQFEKQLADYAKVREERILEQRNMRRDAAWTALFQAGLTPKKIEAWEIERSGDGFSQARIQQAIKKFANAIGLTLRKPKAGRNAKLKNR